MGIGFVDMYAKSGNVNISCKLFERTPQWKLVAWIVVIVGYVTRENVNSAHKLFERMPQRDIVPWNVLIAGWYLNSQENEKCKILYLMFLSSNSYL